MRRAGLDEGPILRLTRSGIKDEDAWNLASERACHSGRELDWRPRARLAGYQRRTKSPHRVPWP